MRSSWLALSMTLALGAPLAGCSDKSADDTASDAAGADGGDGEEGTDGADGADGADGTDGTDGGEPLPEAWTEYYRADSVIDAGGFVFEEVYWVRRQLDPEAATITEEFVSEIDAVLTLTELVVDAEANTFTLTINTDEYTGAGSLEGPAWAWTAWSSVSTAADGSYVESSDVVTAEGITAAKVGFAADGTQEWTLDEVLVAVDEATWAAGIAAAEEG